MKEATGGSLLMGLAAAILIVFIVFVAFFINYGKTFKIKNQIINNLEQSEGLSSSDLKDYIYNKTKYGINKFYEVCYNKIKRSTGEVVGLTYKITLYMTFDRTVLGSDFDIKIPISGETKTITSGTIYDDIDNIDISECIE